MDAGEGFLDGFRHEMRDGGAADRGGEQIAIRLRDHLAAECEKRQAPIVDLLQWAANVEIEVKAGAMWTIECLHTDAYHVYPAHIREDGGVVWPNVWVAADLRLDEMIARVRTEVFGWR